MTSFAFVFPGQGSQSVGMLDAWGDNPVVAQTLAEASDAMGENIAKLIHEGPKEALGLTTNRAFYLSKKPNTVFGEMAVLVLEGEAIQDSSYLLELLKRDIPAYMHPKEVVFVDRIQFTDTGKVIRKSIA